MIMILKVEAVVPHSMTISYHSPRRVERNLESLSHVDKNASYSTESFGNVSEVMY